ncbi:MAG: hypothetical protein F6K24_16970 [Okeania sp. SIO2D1]|nr:hypothetical protein [Okeania sp. SIO2D1]
MPDFILIDGDKVKFNPLLTPIAFVSTKLGTLKGSGKSTLNGKKVCIEGDEKELSVPDCAYTTPVYSIAGTGTLTIAELVKKDHIAQKTNSGGKPVLLKGSTFTAQFEVQNPAKKPPTAPGENPTPDNTKQYSGTGTFITTNTKWQGS